MPSTWRYGISLLRAPALEIGFVLRSCLRWSRGDAALANESKQELFSFVPVEQRSAVERRAADLLRTFDLGYLQQQSTRSVFTSSLARLDALAQLTDGMEMPVDAEGVVRAADFGCGDFHYATVLQRWLSMQGGGRRRIVLRGFELDGHGIYRDGHSRADHARSHARLAGDSSEVRFEVADCTAVRLPPQQVVTLFFPFLSAYASLRWGTPLSRLRPRRLLRRAVASLTPGGWLVVANQTTAEFERLGSLLADQPVRMVAQRSFASPLVAHAAQTEPQIGSVWQRRQGPQ